MGYLLVRRPYMLAHRGASAYAPENTIAAFERALALRTDGIETDVRATSDGVLVLIHDERVDRTTDGEGRVQDLPFDALQRLDAGGSFHPRYAGERIPTAEAVLDRYGGRLPLCLEVKQVGIEAQLVGLVRGIRLRNLKQGRAVGIEAQLVGLVRARDLLAGRPPADASSAEQVALPPVVFTSFAFASCQAVKAAADEAVVGFLARDFDDRTIERCAEAALDQICPPADACTPARVAAARDRGLAVRAWGAAEREVLRDAIKAGVDGVTCNWPDWSLQPTR